MVRTRSVAVAPSGSSPCSRNPTTRGSSIDSDSPSMTASASIPPMPQPRTPRALTMVVCESVPRHTSGKAQPSLGITTRARYSMLTWCMIPTPGGTTAKSSRVSVPSAGTGSARCCGSTRCRRCASKASLRPKTSAITEWSMTSSAGISGFTTPGLRPARPSRAASRRGRPVSGPRSCRAGRPARGSGRCSGVWSWFCPQSSRVWIWPEVMWSTVLVAQQVLQDDAQAVGQRVDRQAVKPLHPVGAAAHVERAGRGEGVEGPDVTGSAHAGLPLPAWFSARNAASAMSPGKAGVPKVFT